MTLFRCLDFETTGFPPDAGIVEIGWCDVEQFIPVDNGVNLPLVCKVGGWESILVNPGRAIEIAAMAIHHIQDSDLEGKPTPEIALKGFTEDVDYFVAHNAKFEKAFFNPPDIPWICTLKAAYRLCPKAPNHQNQTLRYFLKTPVNATEAIMAHRAGPDAYVTAHTLAKFLTAVPASTMSLWEGEPPHIPYCPIGKERGKPWPEVDEGFLSWMCFKAPKLEEDIKWNAMREYRRRHS